ncbi:SDR family oxidoreductase [Zobellia galactanivorans]|uniref:Short-chain dehydrogenase/reductase n=1 Tax=Zobellia galactanivorans (strain DSM 12802 / CCUG 47099 / CIP 106680 / NCIMB 13871 / Dsij) TaxID=63186 RepID=G0L4S1_ZOBGA|nr:MULTISPECIES: SDR family oxidoreductase [Zobellia]MBU3025592.1 SDR family oxidoreductase [Zobellia galactanivorans]MDO6808020.1 SDR family oxidoreductase [Zobellia galactanivorans]OWW24915.1 short-chain dehydrogenase/reductase [Zobellia sp. OII3]CAZ98868.1 Short-chain dehydrogenase/reductase [Zobellia galactanivorans]
MEQKVVLITGGSSGIGKSIGVYLKSKGFKVYGTTRNLAKHRDFEVFDLLELDVSDQGSIVAAVDYVISKENRLDVLVNNAGVGITGPLEETPTEEVQKAFDTNVYGPLRMVQAVLPQMRKQKGGTIINITSIAGYMGLPYRGVYSATKAALSMLTEALRMETKAFDIKITTLAPGDFATNIAAGRYHSPLLEDSPYKKPYGNTLKMMNDDVSNGGDPIAVAKQVFEIVENPKPRVHYKVGSPLQKFSVVLKSLLPDKVYEKLLLNHYKL